MRDSEVTVNSVAVKTAPTKVTYTEGENLDLTGLVVTLTKSDASIEDVVFADFATKGITTNKANGIALATTDTKVVISVNGKTVNQAITVNAAAPSVNAVAPAITTDLTDKTTPKETAVTLDATATVTDGGTVSYQWYKADDVNKTNAQLIAEATSATYKPAVNEEGTFYYYCVVTNTNNNATGTKTAETISVVSKVTVTVSDSTVKGTAPSVTTTKATFDKKTESQAEVYITFALGTEDLAATKISSVKIGEDVLKADTDYTVSETTLTLKKDKLATLEKGEATVTITFNDTSATAKTVTVTVNDSTL